ncbi:MAG: hypothetical protein QXI89_02650 [Candidatus Anstonellales archaeon]
MRVKKIEESYLQKFKNQVKISKMFGKDAIKVYNAVSKDEWIDEKAVAKLTGLDESSILKIFEFMEKEGMLAIYKEVSEKVGEKEIKEEIKERPEIEAREEKVEIEREEAKREEAEREEALGEGLEGGEEAKEFAEEIEKEVEEEKAEIHEGKAHEIEFEEEIKPEFETGGIVEKKPGKEELPTEEIRERETAKLSDEERDVYNVYGETGVDVLNKLKEGKTTKEISLALGMEERDIKEIENFLLNKGYIKAKEAVVETTQKAEPAEEDKYAPLTAKGEELVSAVKDEDAIKLIKMKKLSFFDKLKNKFFIVLRHKKFGRLIFETIDKEKEVDTITLVEKNLIDIKKVEAVIEDMKKAGIIEISQLSRDEIRKKFGYDSLSIYRKYGKAGVIMYDLVGKDLRLKEIANLAGLTDKEKIYEIFSFIHRLLGIEIPLDKTLIMKQLE